MFSICHVIESEFKMKKVGVVKMKVALLPKETESSLFTVNFFQNVKRISLKAEQC